MGKNESRLKQRAEEARRKSRKDVHEGKRAQAFTMRFFCATLAFFPLYFFDFPFGASAFDRIWCSINDGNPLLRHSISMPGHARRATASPLILRLRLWLKLPVRISVLGETGPFWRSVITKRLNAVRIRIFSVTSANVGCYKRRYGHDTLFGYEIDAFHRSVLRSLLHRAVYWQWLIRYTILLLRRLWD